MAKYDSIADYFASLPEDQSRHIQSLVDFVTQHYPQLELVIAWNQPMFKLNGKYVIGFMPTKKHTNLLTVTDTAITTLEPELSAFKHGTRSISLPFDWVIDSALIGRVITLRAEELGLPLTR